MKNYGDVYLINGCKVEAVDCVIGGSPCQNLSVAGNRKGLEGSESRLFLEQMRVVKEMRQATGFQKPRYMVWENVVGALSCNKGKDFQCVLNECVETALLGKINLNKGTKDGEENLTEEDRDGRETGIPDVPMPKDGKWSKSGILYDDMGRWSIAWRVHDAQYWGVAQRRRRLALVCDFGGMSAPEVLFESQSVSGDFNTRNSQGEGTARASDECITEPDKVWDARGNGDGNLCSTLTGDHDNRITDYTNVVVQKKETYSINGDSHESGLSVMSEVSHALKTTTKESVFVEQGSDDVSSGQSYPCICIGNGQAHVTEHYTEEVSQTLNCMHDPMTILEPVIPFEGNGCRDSHKGDGWSTEQVSYTLNTVERHGVAYGEIESSDPQAVAQPVQYSVRRLTPLECTRLQGYPDGWVDIGDWIDSKGKKHKEADAPKYKALGNSIALPFWKWLCRNIVNELQEYGYTPTMASLFDGIGGFPLCWTSATHSKESVLWVSEIEEFPLAVTRHHFSLFH